MQETISTTLGTLPIRRAAEADLSSLTLLLQNAQAWLDQQNIAQWIPGAHDPSIIGDIVRQETGWVVEHDGRVIAVCQLAESLPDFWMRAVEKVGYISTLAVERDHAGYGIGTAVLRWAETNMRSSEKMWACLDCYAKNPALCAYYERQGYSAIGEVETYPDYPQRLFQKRLDCV